jgi:hypothetical protein
MQRVFDFAHRFDVETPEQRVRFAVHNGANNLCERTRRVNVIIERRVVRGGASK